MPRRSRALVAGWKYGYEVVGRLTLLKIWWWLDQVGEETRMGWERGRGRNFERKSEPRWTAPVPEIVWSVVVCGVGRGEG